MEVFPISRVDDLIEQISSVKYILILDLPRWYWQVPMVKSDKHKRTFVTLHEMYQFYVIAFGLTEASGAFQRKNDYVL